MKAYDLFGLVFQTNQSAAFKSAIKNGDAWMPVRWQTDEFGAMCHVGRLHIYKGNGTPGKDQAVHLQNNRVTVRIPWTLLQFSDPSRSQVIDDDVSPDICRNYRRCNGQYLKTSRTDGIVLTLVCDNTAVATTPYTWDDWNVVGALLSDKGLAHPDILQVPYDSKPGFQETILLDANMYVEEPKASLHIVREELNRFPFTPK
jgi:hypothetical protein